jgi:hypothetical protein
LGNLLYRRKPHITEPFLDQFTRLGSLGHVGGGFTLYSNPALVHYSNGKSKQIGGELKIHWSALTSLKFPKSDINCRKFVYWLKQLFAIDRAG